MTLASVAEPALLMVCNEKPELAYGLACHAHQLPRSVGLSKLLRTLLVLFVLLQYVPGRP